MPHRLDLLPLTLSAFGFLVLITLAGLGLRVLLAPDRSNAVIENLNARISSWWVITLLLGAAMLMGSAAVVLLFAFASFAALREFLTLTDTHRADHYALAAAFFLILPVQYYLVWLPWYGLFSIFIPVYAFLLMPTLSMLRGEPGKFLVRVAELQWALMLCVFALSHIPALLSLEIPGFEARQALLIAFMVMIVQGADVLQYLYGQLMSEHRVVPWSSKSWEGGIAAVATSAVIGALLFWMTPFSPPAAAMMAALLAMLGFFGTLVMSAIKRDRGVKDWGTVLNAEGGFIDRLDGVLFAAPIFFHLVRYFYGA